MKTFLEWLAHTDRLARLRLIETYYSFDAQQYNQLFDQELAKLMGRVVSPDHRAALERMRGFGWVAYIAQCVRNAGWYDQRQVQERIHDIVVKLLMGGLFRTFDERTSGPIDLRFKRSVANAIKNIAEKERNRRRLLPTVSLGNEWRPDAEDVPDRASTAQGDDEMIGDFRRLVQVRLGEVGLAVLDARLTGQETKGLVGRPDLGSPGAYAIKRTVQSIKMLARQYAEQLGDPAFLRDIERAMGREEQMVQKRRATTVMRQVASS
jgi:hypothetical protein